MKSLLKHTLILLPLAFASTGCVVAVNGGEDFHDSSYFEKREYKNRKNLAKVHLGMSFNQVQDLFGSADFNESYEKEGGNIQVLFYRTNRVHKDDLTTKDECTPILFKNGQVIAWGDTAYNKL